MAQNHTFCSFCDVWWAGSAALAAGFGLGEEKVLVHLAPCVNEVPELTARGKHEILVAGSAPQRAYIWRTSAVASAPSASGRDGACPGVLSTAIAACQRIRRDPALLLRHIAAPH